MRELSLVMKTVGLWLVVAQSLWYQDQRWLIGTGLILLVSAWHLLDSHYKRLANTRLQPTAFGVGMQAEFPLHDFRNADESSATNGGG